jgi:hypothetical protein
LAAADKAPPSGTYYNGRREQRLPAALCDAAVQDRAWTVGQSLVSTAMNGGSASLAKAH